METKYNHQLIEKGKEKKWQAKQFFSNHDEQKKPFAILLPPPNVTGKLHLGHAWDGMIQDTLIRYHKLQGYDVMWIPGMDHAGIATQARVEKELQKTKQTRYDLGREKFVAEVWKWKKEYASIIRKQWAKLGLALDYQQEKFTLDDDIAQAVTKVFIDLHQRKLIYRGNKPVNWDPQLKTVLSNIEVDAKEIKQKMYYINYDLVNGKQIAIATVRPETLFSDVAIAINPKDEKMKHYLQQEAIHPLTKNKLPIIADESIEIGKGTGAMKVSAHAEPDWDIIKKHHLAVNECIDENGLMNQRAGKLAGMDRFQAREQVVKMLGKRIYKVEETISAVGHSQRSGVPIEILVRPQWFVKMQPLAKLVLANLKTAQKTQFIPARFEKTLSKWLIDIQDWCISRQLWWGHRIPAWYRKQEVKVQLTSPGPDWKQDEDVLDTWFSSGIAPFAFLGWPESNNNLKRFYPTDVLVTGYDIIFFWVARMYFQALDIMKEIPFKKVLIHGLIRAADGNKMSKSLNNGIDPMQVIDQYGADALRWFLLTNSAPGQDIRFSETKLAAAWNLNNKIWNISRYILTIMPTGKTDLKPIDHWIKQQLNQLIKTIEIQMQNYEFTIIGKAINKFIIEDFSNWYIEISKMQPNQEFAKEILANLMIVIHPFMPFISDHIYHVITNNELLDQKWPLVKKAAHVSLTFVINLIKLLRNFRAQNQILNKETLPFWTVKKLTIEELTLINKLANAQLVNNHDLLIPLGQDKIYLKLSPALKDQKKQTQLKQLKFLEAEIARAQKLLNNPHFIAKASKDKITLEKNKLSKYQNEYQILKTQQANK